MNEDNAVLQLLDVLEIEYSNNIQNNDKPRTFCAISLRKRADTVIKSENGTLNLSDRSLTFFPSNTSYFRQSTYDDMIVIHFNSSVPLCDRICTITDFDYGFILDKFENALSIWKGYDFNKYYKVSAIMYEIIAEFFKNRGQKRYSEKMQKAIDYIKSNLQRTDLSVNDIACRLNICPTALRSLFHREACCSPKQFIIKTRMTKAQSMLNGGYWSVTQIAEQLGFPDQKNFSTAYKKHFGYPPSKQKYTYKK